MILNKHELINLTFINEIILIGMALFFLLLFRQTRRTSCALNREY